MEFKKRKITTKKEILLSILLTAFCAFVFTFLLIQLISKEKSSTVEYLTIINVFLLLNVIVNIITCFTSFYCLKESVKLNFFLFYLSIFGLFFLYNFVWILFDFYREWHEKRIMEMVSKLVPFFIFVIGQIILSIKLKR